MTSILKGNLDGKGKTFAVIVSRFNETISERLLSGALDMLERHGTEKKNINIFWVPGSFEIPLIAKKLAETRKYNAVICLGAIIRGDTPHFDFIASQASRGIAQVSLDTGVPCIFGVLTCDTIEQAIERSGTKSGNKGAQAALDALELSDLLNKIKNLK